MKRIRIVHVLIFLACLLAVAAGLTVLSDRGEVVAPRDWDEIASSRQLTVVMEYTPASYMRVGDTIQGEQYRLVNALSEHLGIPLQICLENDLQKSIDGLRRGDYDLVARLIPVTTDMRGLVSFTDPIATDKQVLVQREKSDTTVAYVASQLDLSGKKIFVTEGSPYIQRLSNMAQEIAAEDFTVVQMPNYNEEQLATLVAAGEIDYAVCDYETARRCAVTHPNLDLSTNISFSQLKAWAVREESPVLLDSVNAWLRTLTKNGAR